MTIQTTEDTQVINITERVLKAVSESGVRRMVYLTTMHTTTTITVNKCLQMFKTTSCRC